MTADRARPPKGEIHGDVDGAGLQQRGSDAGRPPLTAVGIGASAGGLDAFIKLVTALPADSGMAFILVQHLDPTHPSLMVELLAGHTRMPVHQAADGMPVQADRVFIIPPGTYLSVRSGSLRLSKPAARHGARMPVDFLLRSLAEEYGARAIGIILSGTGDDGSLGVRAVHDASGLVIVQAPDEAANDGMPQSAIATGAVDLILRVADMPAAIMQHHRKDRRAEPAKPEIPADAGPGGLAGIIAMLRERTVHDFTMYKRGTLQRRIERRMALIGIPRTSLDRYLERLRSYPAELDLLAQDLLINVTSFFRDEKVFALLEQTVIPDLLRPRPNHDTIRIWIAACSTGEETYSLAMLFHQQITTLQTGLKLQVFASDIDAAAVATARGGVYPAAIANEVPKELLSRYFVKEEQSYRVSPELRATIVFTVQDVLADPPFSRLDMVSCRNLLIYLQPEAQAKVISQFHFALRAGGVLLLGTAETIGAGDGRFEPISKSERLYRHLGRSLPNGASLPAPVANPLHARAGADQAAGTSRQASFAELGRRLILDSFAPASVLINRSHACLYTLGPTDRYLRVPAGHHTSDLLAMARPGIRTRLKAAILRAFAEKTRIVISGGRVSHAGRSIPFNIDVQPVPAAGEALLLICFVDEPAAGGAGESSTRKRNTPAADALKQDLEAVRTELQGALRDLEASAEEQKAINEEALSVNEEFQSTNEELLTSKEELQSLNEELTALNSQLQETLDRQRTTADDLQNVLYSTDVATLFLDSDLRIRFFTPASKALFNIIQSDVGRPLADLRSLAADSALPSDAQAVLEGLAAVEREVETSDGVWFLRRTLPYRAHDRRVEGVVITFTDVTERKLAARALEAAKQRSETANLAKTRFLAAASHDLRQPLQTLKLLQGLLAKAVETERSRKLVVRVGETLGAMSSMLNALLDINQIEAGIVEAKVTAFPVNDMLIRLTEEFSYQAQAQGLALRFVPSSLVVVSDPRLLEQMVRNLLSNALKYTRRGRILLGCRRHAGRISIEIWDTGIGIADDQLKAIFEEYHQLDNAARERSRGLGLGLAIVQRLGNLLGHPVRVRSRTGSGSVFAIDIAHPAQVAPAAAERSRAAGDPAAEDTVRRTGVILVVEDDPSVSELLQLVLQDEGHVAVTTPDGRTALQLIVRGTLRPDVVITDYNLPRGLNGLELALQLREVARPPIPTVILTGDISTETLSSIARHDLLQLNKPVRLEDLAEIVHRLLRKAPSAAPPIPAPADMDGARPAGVVGRSMAASVFVIDDDAQVRAAIGAVLEDEGHVVRGFASSEAFLDAYRPGPRDCLVVDGYLPGMSGLDLLRHLRAAGQMLPAIMITGQSDVKMAVEAMKAGAMDFIEKPAGRSDLLASIGRAIEQADDTSKRDAWREDAASRVATLTARQRQIMGLVLAGQPSKNIASDLKVSQRTVENHRASIMRKTGVTSLPALARLAQAASREEPMAPLAPG